MAHALESGLRGLTGKSSLPCLLAERRGVRNQGNLPRLTETQILAWADEHYRRTQRWPTGCYAVWYPIKQARTLNAFMRKIATLPCKSILRAELLVRPDDSPLRLNGRAFVARVQEALGAGFAVELAMRYGEPSIENGLRALDRRNLNRKKVICNVEQCIKRRLYGVPSSKRAIAVQNFL